MTAEALPTVLFSLASVFSLVIAVIFVHGAVSKLRNWQEFAAVVRNYKILPRRVSAPFALALPLAELAAGVLLAVPGCRPYGGGLVASILVVMSGAVWINLARGRSHIDCGCGGAVRHRLSYGLILRNAVLAIGALAVTAAPAQIDGVGSWGLALIGVGTGVGVLLFLSIDQLIANWSVVQAEEI